MEFRMTVTTSEVETLISQTEHLKALEAESRCIRREAPAEFAHREHPRPVRNAGCIWVSSLKRDQNAV